MDGGKFNAQTVRGLGVSETAQLTVDRHWRTTDKLKLTDVPACRPCRNGRGCLFQQLTAFVIGFTIKSIAVDVFGNVFSDIAGSAALFRVNGLGMKARLFGLIASQFVTVFLPRIIANDEAHALDIFRQHEHKHVPVRRPVVMRFGNTYAENADFFPV